MVGLPDSGAFLERRIAGLRRVTILERQEVTNFTNYSWGYQVGLLGEKLQVYTDDGARKVQWSKLDSSSKPLTWYKTSFDTPAGNDPLVLNLSSMGKGEAWVNGESIGRYWVSFQTPAGFASQTCYNIPRSFLKPTGNLLVLLDEENGNPLDISIDTVSITKVCGHVSDSHLPPVASWKGHNQDGRSDEMPQVGRRPVLQLLCPSKGNISKIHFASFGTPPGDCNSYSIGSCHFYNSRAIVEKACLGKRKCFIPHSIESFGSDPCPGIPKALLVDAQCE